MNKDKIVLDVIPIYKGEIYPTKDMIYHYKNEPKIYYYLDFQKNIKLTYKEDLDYATFLMNEKKRKVKKK